MSSRPSISFDRIADQYDESRGGRARGARMAADLAPWLVAGRVLEVAVGTGLIATALREGGREVYGVDLSRQMLVRAADRLGARVAQADAAALPVRNSSVDNVVCVMALHVIGDAAGALAEVARVLRPGGRLLASYGPPTREPGDDDIAEAMAPLDALRTDRPDKPTVVADAVARAGLSPVEVTTFAGVEFTETPAQMADGIERRLWSYLWRVEPDRWAAVVEPVLARLRALPDQHRPRPFTTRIALGVYAR